MSEIAQRRPLKVRDASLAKRIAHALSQRDITPNQISVMSVVFALAGAALLVLSASTGLSQGARASLLVLGALTIQLRLLCNLFDGMVAVEGGKKTASGELFNDIPDRIADPLFIVAVGYAAGTELAVTLAWLGALLAVLTAYVRVLAAFTGAPVDFRGPMAKQHRMALLTGALVLSAILELAGIGSAMLLIAALAAIALGSALTAARRAIAAYRFLEHGSKQERS